MSRPIRKVQEVTDDLTRPEDGKYTGDGSADAGELMNQQFRESNEAWAGPGMGPMTDAQWKGFVLGILVGGALGAILFLPVGLLPIGDMAVGWRMLIAAICGAFAGGTAGVLYFGGRQPELEGETLDESGRPDIGSSPRDPGTDARGRQQ